MRKDFVLVEATQERGAHWEYLEAKIPKKDWDLFTELMEHAEQIATLQDGSDMLTECILEMSEVVYGEDDE